jgi:hypothetical protein
MCTPNRPGGCTRPHALPGSDSARWQRTTSGEGPKGPHYLGLAVTSCEKIGSVARVIRGCRKNHQHMCGRAIKPVRPTSGTNDVFKTKSYRSRYLRRV